MGRVGEVGGADGLSIGCGRPPRGLAGGGCEDGAKCGARDAHGDDGCFGDDGWYGIDAVNGSQESDKPTMQQKSWLKLEVLRCCLVMANYCR